MLDLNADGKWEDRANDGAFVWIQSSAGSRNIPRNGTPSLHDAAFNNGKDCVSQANRSSL